MDHETGLTQSPFGSKLLLTRVLDSEHEDSLDKVGARSDEHGSGHVWTPARARARAARRMVDEYM